MPELLMTEFAESKVMVERVIDIKNAPIVQNLNNEFFIDTFKTDLTELKGIVDNLYQTSSELCDVLTAMQSNRVSLKDHLNNIK